MCASETTFIKHLIYITSEDHRSSNSIHNNKKFEIMRKLIIWDGHGNRLNYNFKTFTRIISNIFMFFFKKNI